MRFLISLPVLCLSLAASAQAAPTNMLWKQRQLENYYQSGSYATDINAVIQRAEKQLSYAVQHNTTHKKLAIVLDIDETSLSNYNQIEALYSAVSNVGDIPNKAMLKTVNNPFVDTAIEPTLRLYKEAKQDGVTVFFLTGRYEYDRAGTVKNMHAVGFNSWKKLILRQPKQYHIPATVYKTAARKKIEANGYDIIINVGDQYSDLRGGYADNTYKLPNPFYYIP